MSNVVKDLFTFVAATLTYYRFLRFLSGYDKNSHFHFAAAASFTVFEHISNLLILYEIQSFQLLKIGEDC